jgi:replication factor C subunit 3/5
MQVAPTVPQAGLLKAESKNSDSDPALLDAASLRALPWVEKYRPRNLRDVLGHDYIVGTLRKMMISGDVPHMLLYGPPGTGKTSSILALARDLNPASFSSVVLELNASDQRGIETVRQQIKNFVSSKILFQNHTTTTTNPGIEKRKYMPKLVVLDEADMLTMTAQMALRRIIEQFSATARFCIIANYVHKIIPAIQSRCTRFRYAPLPDAVAMKRVQEIADLEKVKLTPDGLAALVRIAEGDMRKMFNILQGCSYAALVNEETICQCTGTPTQLQIQHTFSTLTQKPFLIAVQAIKKLVTEHAIALPKLVTHLHHYIMNHVSEFTDNIWLNLVLERLATVERQLSIGASDHIQTLALAAAFTKIHD